MIEAEFMELNRKPGYGNDKNTRLIIQERLRAKGLNVSDKEIHRILKAVVRKLRPKR